MSYASELEQGRRNFRISSRLADAERDTQPHMTAAANAAIPVMLQAINEMTQSQKEGAIKMLNLMFPYRSSAGYKRLYGLTIPNVLASLESK